MCGSQASSDEIKAEINDCYGGAFKAANKGNAARVLMQDQGQPDFNEDKSDGLNDDSMFNTKDERDEATDKVDKLPE